MVVVVLGGGVPKRLSVHLSWKRSGWRKNKMTGTCSYWTRHIIAFHPISGWLVAAPLSHVGQKSCKDASRHHLLMTGADRSTLFCCCWGICFDPQNVRADKLGFRADLSTHSALIIVITCQLFDALPVREHPQRRAALGKLLLPSHTVVQCGGGPRLERRGSSEQHGKQTERRLFPHGRLVCQLVVPLGRAVWVLLAITEV